METSAAPTPGSTPRVSIGIPAYNHARYLERTLESLLEDGYPALEVLVLDDGSSDDGAGLARRWLERRGSAFAAWSVDRQPNAGICKTLNRLMARATGDYFSPLASDDLLLPGGIAARVEALRSRPDWLAVAGDAAVIGPDGERLHDSAIASLRGGEPRLLGRDRTRAWELVLRWSLPGPVMMLRRGPEPGVYGVGPYEESSAVEDRDYALRLLSRNALGFLPRAVAAYRVHPDAFCRTEERRESVIRALLQACERHADAFRGIPRLALRLEAAVYRQKLVDRDARPFRIRLVKLLKKALLLLHRVRSAFGS